MVKKIGLLQLVFMLYGLVCAGAYGLESMVSASGPGITLVVLLITPLLFSIPIALTAAELTGAYPLAGGTIGWVEKALGKFWGFLSGWWTWLANLVSFSSYVVLFNLYLVQWIPEITPFQQWLLALVLIWGLTLVNHFGIRIVGDSSVIMSFLLVLPFILVIIFGIFHWRLNPFVPFANPEFSIGQAWLAALAWAVWLYSAYERLSVSGDEVENPVKNFPKALVLATILTAISYFLPTMVALGSAENPEEWKLWDDGYFTTVAGRYGIAWIMTAGALISNILIANVTLLSNSRYLAAMARVGMLPEILAKKHQKWNTPTLSLIGSSIVYSLMTLMSFADLIYANAWICVGIYALIYISAYRLRTDGQHRPIKIPIPDSVFLVMGIPTILLGLIGGILYFDLSKIGLLFLLSGPVLYLFLKKTLSEQRFENSNEKIQ